MKKKDTKMDKPLLCLAIISLAIALVEGFFYYDTVEYWDPCIRIMLIIQNGIKAFSFKADIDLRDIMSTIRESKSFFEFAVGYAYSLAIFTAPFCTIAVLYKIFERVLRIRNWTFLKKNKTHIIIFGYNEEVKALLSQKKETGAPKDKKEKKLCVHVVSCNIPEEDERYLLKNKISIHKVDLLDLEEKHQDYFFKQMWLGVADSLILFEESSAKNFSLYYLFSTLRKMQNNSKKQKIKDDVKIYCRCEDNGTRKLIEEYHDNNTGEENDLDVELISMYDQQVKKLLSENSLHQYYIDKKESDIDKWHLHLLIVGFGNLGQQLLLQAMSMGVVSSKNDIIIDVIDFDSDNASFFVNNFSDDYVKMDKDELYIPSTKEEPFADGKFKVRFHKVDVRKKQFYDVLMKCSIPEANVDNSGEFTYIAVCMKNEDLNCAPSQGQLT